MAILIPSIAPLLKVPYATFTLIGCPHRITYTNEPIMAFELTFQIISSGKSGETIGNALAKLRHPHVTSSILFL
jgi:hypothetical protein